MSLSKHSTIEELFDCLDTDPEQVQVVPVTASDNGDPIARMLIVIQGAPTTAHTIMANLMTAVQDMHDIADQKTAEKADEKEKPRLALVGSDGEPLTDDSNPIIS